MLIETTSLIISAIATCVIAYFSYKSNQITTEMKEIAKKTQSLTDKIDTQNQIQRDKVNKIFWALVFSNALVDTNPANRKERIGFIIKTFGWENIKNDININNTDLISAINARCAKYVDELTELKDENQAEQGL